MDDDHDVINVKIYDQNRAVYIKSNMIFGLVHSKFDLSPENFNRDIINFAINPDILDFENSNDILHDPLPDCPEFEILYIKLPSGKLGISVTGANSQDIECGGLKVVNSSNHIFFQTNDLIVAINGINITNNSIESAIHNLANSTNRYVSILRGHNTQLDDSKSESNIRKYLNQFINRLAARAIPTSFKIKNNHLRGLSTFNAKRRAEYDLPYHRPLTDAAIAIRSSGISSLQYYMKSYKKRLYNSDVAAAKISGDS